ncbi:MAG: hypothetical protein J6K26_00700 [Lachnospiraceae bacterium]|nr:hypothetical protein [Lachnospiraceae bacterium]
MKRVLVTITSIIMLLFSACGQQQTNGQEPSESVVQSSETVVLSEMKEPAKTILFSFEGTVFHYGEQVYDVASRVQGINSIIDVIPVGEKIIVECHAGPKNEVYCIFDTTSQFFENDLIGCNLIWYDNDIKTAVYSFWSDIYAYDGSVIKSYDLTENEFIDNMMFSDDNTKLIVTICTDDDGERIDTIEL